MANFWVLFLRVLFVWVLFLRLPTFKVKSKIYGTGYWYWFRIKENIVRFHSIEVMKSICSHVTIVAVLQFPILFQNAISKILKLFK